MEINTHGSEVFVSANDSQGVTLSVCAAVGIGAALFGVGVLVGRLTKKSCPAVKDCNNRLIDLEGCDDPDESDCN